jgi:ABC-2 type transport system ATP-binding protein
LTSSISTKGLRKFYGDAVALGGIDLEVPAGAVTAVLGPNGAGKTSLIEILEGNRKRSGGRVEVLGRDPAIRSDYRVLRTQIGVVLQHSSLTPGLRVKSFLDRQASYYEHPANVDGILAEFDLIEHRTKLARTLSGGITRRLDLAAALIGRPRLLFLDEPTAGLDPLSRRAIRDYISRVTEQGVTVLLTSHDLSEVEQTADRVIVLNAGTVLMEGSVREVIDASSADSVIEFRATADVELLLPGLGGPYKVEDGVVRIATVDASASLARLTEWSARTGAPLERITVTRPSLDEAYLSLLYKEEEGQHVR